MTVLRRFLTRFTGVVLVALAVAACQSRSGSTRGDAPIDQSTLDGAAPLDAADDGAQVTDAAWDAKDTGTTVWKPPADASDGSELWARCHHVTVEKRCRDGWCEIPAGCFVGGSPETEWGRALVQEEQVLVTLTRTFVIQQTEVTQAAWTSEGFANPSGTQPNGKGDCLDPECPVGRVTWFEALAYANRLSEKHNPPLKPCYVLHGCQGQIGKDFECTAAETIESTVYECDGFRLPTNAEWEYSARGGTRTTFYSGNITVHPEFLADPYVCLPDSNLQRIAWYCQEKSHPVAQLEPNGWGLFDTSGNAEEWVNDPSDGRPPSSNIDPGGTVGLHVTHDTRGGAFSSPSKICRTAARNGAGWNNRRVGLGLRLVRTGKLTNP